MGALGAVARESSASGIVLAKRARARTLRAFAQATREMFGEHVERALMESLPSADGEWVDVEAVVAICERAWRGPLGHDEEQLRVWTDRMMDRGFGLARKLLLAIATPSGLLRRAGDLWRDEFTTGRLVAYNTSPTTALATLHDHIFLETELMRAVVSETFRYSVQLTGAKDVREVHEIAANGALVVHLSWR